jgi:predicted ATPase
VIEVNYIDRIEIKEDIEELDEYVKDILSLKEFLGGKPVEFKNNVTYFVGENGSGKSTLLEAIAIAFGMNAEGGGRWHQFETVNTSSNLHKYIKIIKKISPQDTFFLRAESFYNAISNLDMENINHECSHGESFFELVNNRFWGNGLYIMDEPEAALSPQRQLSMLCKIDELVNKNSQFIIITHSPIMLAYPNSTIYSFTEEGIKEIRYEETESYKLYKTFLADPKRMIGMLLEE